MEGVYMPQLSVFFGIVIQMFFNDTKHHNLPHIHVFYSGHLSSIAIEDGQVLAGSIPSKQLSLVQKWITIHKEELMKDWELAISCQPLFKIPPLTRKDSQ